MIAVDLRLAATLERGQGPQVEWVEADTADADAMAHAASLAAVDGGRLDICVANAGIAGIEDFLDGSASSWKDLLRVNLIGTMVALQAAARLMVRAAWRWVCGLRPAIEGQVTALPTARPDLVEFPPHGARNSTNPQCGRGAVAD